MFESQDYKEGYNEGYKNGREWYVNDIGKEISDINTAIRTLTKYNQSESKSVKELYKIKEILLCLQAKVKKEYDTKFN